MSLLMTGELQQDLAAVGARLRAITVLVEGEGGRRARAGQGSGIVWGADGTIVTNAHVATADLARVTLADGRAARAQVIARDARRDLAILRLDRDALGPAPLEVATPGTPTALRPGELLLALGHPLGVAHALALGVVHAAPRSTRAPYLAADIRLAPGNSGGPLADARGRVVGINTMIVGGLGVAVSVDAVRGMLVSLGRARRAA